MRTIVCNYIGKRGAGALYAYEMIKGFISNGKFVIAIIPDNIENLSLWKNLPNCKLILIKGYSDSYISFIVAFFMTFFLERRKIRKVCNSYEIDFIYIPMIQPLALMVNSIIGNKKTITTIHDPKPHKGTSRLLSWMYKKTALRSTKLIILSESFRSYVAREYKHASEDILYIPHGVFDNYKKIYDVKFKHNYDTSKINFVFFGRITPYKGLDILAKAYEKLYFVNNNVALTIVGNGDFSPYKRFYDTLRNVTIINRWIRDEEVYGFYDGANVITILPYTEATQSGVIPLAMSSNSLIISSDTGGLREQVSHNITGILVEPNNVDNLFEAMLKVCNEGINTNIIRNAKQYIESLSWNTLSRKLLTSI